jgi:GntR family transcriptional regulator/MocR family aminotransferase
VPVDVTGEQAGLHLSITLPRGFRDHEIAERAARQKLWLAPLSSSYLERPSPQGFVLGFSNTSVEDMPRVDRRLNDILHAH